MVHLLKKKAADAGQSKKVSAH